MPIKPKAIEIFFFPKKNDMNSFDFTKLSKKKEIGKKNEIQVVGDKELRNEFKNFKLKPAFPILTKKVEVRNYDNGVVTQVTKKEPPVIVEDMTFSFAQKFARDDKQREKEDEKDKKKIEDMKEETGAETSATVVVSGGDDYTTTKSVNTI